MGKRISSRLYVTMLGVSPYCCSYNLQTTATPGELSRLLCAQCSTVPILTTYRTAVVHLLRIYVLSCVMRSLLHSEVSRLQHTVDCAILAPMLIIPPPSLLLSMFLIPTEQLYSRVPVAKIVESEEDLHIFGLVAAVNEVVPTAQESATRQGDYRPGRSKVSKLRAGATFAPRQHPPAHPPNRYNEFGGTGRDGGGWGMATGQEPGAAGHEQRQSAATPRAFAMNVDVVSWRGNNPWRCCVKKQSTQGLF